MIRFIAAVDNKLGIADDHGIPWAGQLPTDVQYYRDSIKRADNILMGFGMYREMKKPYETVGKNYVATRSGTELMEGFEAVTDAYSFLENFQGDIWNVGGAVLFESTLDLADELYITRIEKDFNCTKFFPKFENTFELVDQSKPQTENGINFWFETWRPKKS